MTLGTKTNKTLIRNACVKILENPDAKPREILQAAAILEKLVRTNVLGRELHQEMAEKRAKDVSRSKFAALNELSDSSSCEEVASVA